MPAKAAAGAVRALVELDPVRASPQVLLDLLRHPQMPARVAAAGALQAHAGPDLLPLLVPVLADASADVRARALDLLVRIEDPAVLALLVDRLDDRSPAVARKACEALARSADERAEARLLALAFDDPLPTRREAYAWLAIAEREDVSLRAILDVKHAPALLRALDSAQPLVSGAAAIALAGIGFRSPDVVATAWLDREVPERLIGLVAAVEFFSDFDSVRPSALRRLQQISGGDKLAEGGTDGAAWTRWWLAARRDFRASRAVLDVRSGGRGAIDRPDRPRRRFGHLHHVRACARRDAGG
jgi:hypothetical protein